MTKKESSNLPKPGSIFTLLLMFLLSYVPVVAMAVILANEISIASFIFH